MFRSLHVQLIAIVLSTVTAVLMVTQAIDSHFEANAVNQDLRERAELVLRTVESLWGTAPPAALRQTLGAIVESDREVTAIDVFRLHDGTVDLDVSTRPPETLAHINLTVEQIATLSRRVSLVQTLPAREGVTGFRLSVPLTRDGVVRGVAQVEVQSSDTARLLQRILVIDGVVVVVSIVLISAVLTLFLERRVAQPVDALVDGMRQVERGDLAVRLRAAGGSELRFLVERFNAMVGRQQALTDHLEEQVHQATANLEEKNRQLQIANDRLWEAQLEIGRSERLAALGQMAGSLAHELGTPLNSVLGYVQLLRREPLPPEPREKLGIVESQIRRMIDDIRGVLGRTRDVPVRRSPVEIAALVADAVALVAARAAARQLRLRTAVAADLPTLPADALGLRQVLLNLLTNAIDATAAGGEVCVSATLCPPDERGRAQLELAVVDSGHGMSTEELRRAFEPFYTTKGPERGSGLGLAIVEYIVRAHGGQLVADSAPGAGTAVRVRLPLEVRAPAGGTNDRR